MTAQQNLKMQEYINACATKARYEAEFEWSERMGALPEKSTEGLLTRKQVADMLLVSESSVRNWDNEGDLPRVENLGERTVRYTRGSVEKLKRKKKL